MKDSESEKYLDDVFEVLSSSERRNILRYLQENFYTRGDDLIDFLETQKDVDENLEISLHHNHLPKLKDHGWIDYDNRLESFEDYDIRFDIHEKDSKDAVVLKYINQVGDSDDDRLDNVFSVLKDSKRRKIIHWLREENNKSNLSQIATYLAADDSDHEVIAGEYEPTDNEIYQMKINMKHRYIPALEESGIIEYDEASDKLSLSEEYSDPDNLLIQFLEMSYKES